MEYDVIIIGAGPAGYVAAIRAAQVGMKTAIIEKKYIGGMCLNWGCIPSKSIIESAKLFNRIKNSAEFGIEGVDPKALTFRWDKVKARSQKITRKLTAGIGFLLKKNGVDVIMGEAKITGSGSVVVDNRSITAKSIIIATGSYPAPLSDRLSNAPAVHLERIFDLKEIPENIVVYGKGVISIEMAQLFHLIGKSVTVVSEDSEFFPGIDEYLQSFITRKLKADGIPFVVGEPVEKYEDGYLYVKDKKIACDALVNSSFRNAIIPESQPALSRNEQGFIAVNDSFETSIPGVYAIGDVNGKSFLAHIASAQGLWLVNHLKGVETEFAIHKYPLNFYTVPEIAQIGLTEQQIKDEGIEYKVSEFPLTANGKALIEGNTEGFIRMLSDKKYGEVLGVQIVAEHATDMIAEASAYLQMEGTVYDVAQTIHAHPSVSEIFMEAGFEAVDKAIHK